MSSPLKSAGIAQAGQGTSESNLIAALAYLPILQPLVPIVTLLLRSTDPFVKFHSVQALALFGVEFVIGIAIWVGMFIITIATFGIGTLLLIPLFVILALAALALDLFLMFKAYKGEKYKLPIIGDWAENFK